MKHWKAIWFLFILTATLLSCGRPQGQPCYQEDLLYQLEKFYSKHIDSASRILDTLNINVLSEKERAHYCLLKAKVRDCYFKDDDETDSLLQEARKYYIGSKDYFFETETCEALSRVGFMRGEGYAYKIDWLLKGLESIEQCKHVDPRLLIDSIPEQSIIEGKKYKIMWSLGMAYLTNDDEKGVDYLKTAHQYYVNTNNHPMRLRAAYGLSSYYLGKDEFDSCLYYLDLAHQSAQIMGNVEECALCHLQMTYYYMKQTFNTVDDTMYTHQALGECYQGLCLLGDSRYRYKDSFYSCLCKCHYELDQYDSCRYYGEKWKDFMDEHHFKVMVNNNSVEIYHHLYKSCEALGDKDKALYYAGLYADMCSQLKDESKDVEQIIHEYENALERQRLDSEQRIKRIRLYLLLSLVSLALVIVLWQSFRYRKNKDIENLKLQELVDKLRLAMETNQQHSLDMLKNKVMDIYRSGQEPKLDKILAEVEAVFPGMMEKIATTYPKLTKAERNIFMLSFVQFRAKEEADIMGLSENTVMKYRSNIRKKVGNDPFSELTKP